MEVVLQEGFGAKHVMLNLEAWMIGCLSQIFSK
jgi:hypothetical protein